LAYITGTVDQELLLRNEYLIAENRNLKNQIKGRLLLSDPEKKTLAEIGHRLGRKALEDVANAARPDMILGWFRRLVAQKFDCPPQILTPRNFLGLRGRSCNSRHRRILVMQAPEHSF
jgi:hypothetical protein